MKNENVNMSLDGCPDCPYIKFGAMACYKEEVPPTEGSRA
jgi:hypothetical protein